MNPLTHIAAMSTDYKHVVVNLHKESGNAFTLLCNVLRALRKAGAPPVVVDTFLAEAKSGDYDHLLRTIMDWVTVEMECDCE